MNRTSPKAYSRWSPLVMAHEVWRARTVIRALVAHDLRRRYVGSTFGVLWAVAQPLAQLAVFTFVFATVLAVRFGPQGVPFVLYLACGLFPWLAVQESILRSATCLVDNAVLVKRAIFPIAVLPVQLALSALVHQLIALALLLVLMAWFGIPPQSAMLALPLLLGLQLLMTVGCGWAAATLHAYFRDTAQVLSVLLPMWFYLTPIIYPLEMVPEHLRPALAANPLTALMEDYRALLLYGVIPLGSREVWLTIASVGAFVLGAMLFQRARGEFADLV